MWANALSPIYVEGYIQNHVTNNFHGVSMYLQTWQSLLTSHLDSNVQGGYLKTW